MNKTARLAAQFVMLALFLGAANAQNQQAAAPDYNLIDLRQAPGGAAAAHPVTLEEIVSLREVQECRISPDGKTVAFVIKQGFTKSNDYRSALYTVSTSPGQVPLKHLEERSLSQVRWAPDGRHVTYLSSSSGAAQVWRLDPRAGGGKPERVFDHPAGVSQYEWSPDGRRLAFLSAESVSAEEKAAADADGIVYDDSRHSHRNLISKSWLSNPPRLWIYDAQSKSAGQWRVRGEVQAPRINGMVWSPDGRRLAVQYASQSGGNRLNDGPDVGVIHVEENRFEALVTWRGGESEVCWSPDGKSIAFLSAGDIDPKQHFYGTKSSLYRLRIGGGQPVRVAEFKSLAAVRGLRWDDAAAAAGGRLLYEMDDWSTSALYEVPARGGVPPRKVSRTGDHLSAFSFDAALGSAALVRQSTTAPPEVAVMDVKTGRLTTLTELNPEFKNVTSGEVGELRWKNKFGHESNGFLIKPLGYVPGRRYPLLVILYGFSNKFSAQAQWMSSYPAQPFAARGFAVLLMNFTPWEAWPYGDFKKASFWQAENQMAGIDAGVRSAVASGVGDPNKKGIMGWSYGSYLTEYAVTHSDLFEVASAGEGGLNNPGQYWLLGSASMRHYLEGLFGGPPYGGTLKNYEELSPALNAERVRVPLLREYGSEVSFQSLEFYTALRRHNKPVEQIFYNNEAHVFAQPRHRVSSMRRNLDWFSYWLQGREDADPAKRAQYERWAKMKRPKVGDGNVGGAGR